MKPEVNVGNFVVFGDAIQVVKAKSNGKLVLQYNNSASSVDDHQVKVVDLEYVKAYTAIETDNTWLQEEIAKAEGAPLEKYVLITNSSGLLLNKGQTYKVIAETEDAISVNNGYDGRSIGFLKSASFYKFVTKFFFRE